jgi:hypothetical protein
MLYNAITISAASIACRQRHCDERGEDERKTLHFVYCNVMNEQNKLFHKQRANQHYN